MNPKRMILLVVLGCALPVLLKAATNVWPFTTNSQYIVSDPEKIEVADGVAKLKLKASKNYQTTMQQYLTNTAVRAGLSVGPDSSIALSRVGSLYSTYGRYTSRVLDGGVGNTWQKLYARAFGRTGATRGLWEMASETNLAALYHFNNSSLDAISGSSGTPFGSPTYTSDAKLGSHALLLNGGNYMQLANASLLLGTTQATVMCWAKLTAYTDQGGIIYSRGSSTVRYIGLTQTSGGGYINASYSDHNTVSLHRLSLNQWYHIAATYANNGGMVYVKLYINGVLDGSSSSWFGYATLTPDDYFKVGRSSFSGNLMTAGVFDEVAIINRVLSADEVTTIYQHGAAAFGLQIRSGASSDLTGSFVGPDGTPNSYFLAETEPLATMAGFDVLHQYAQYRAYMVSDQTQTPYLDAAGLFGSLSSPIDNVMGDFMQGEYTESTTNLPSKPDTPFMGLAKDVNGGFYTNGTYTSRVLDGGAGVTWGQLSWKFGEELAGDILGLEGLWHANGTWSDASPRGNSGTGPNIGYTDLAKLGSLSPVFNGSSSYASILSISAGINTIEWWMKSDQLSDGILELTSVTYVAMSNRQIRAVGFPAGAVVRIYINGKAAAPLINGWNHVAVVSDLAVTNMALTIGKANGDFYQGQMDEIAIFSRALSLVEITAHCLSGRRTVAGKLRVQIRGSSLGTPTNTFTGPGAIGGYFDDPSGTSLSGYTNRYLQYRVTMLGDGEATPSLDALTLTRGVGAAFVDDTIDEVKQGTFDAGQTRWYGDEMTLVDLVAVGAPAIDPIRMSGFGGIWHMDESQWLAGPTVRDSAGQGNNGSPEGDAKPTSTAKVGTYAGTFDGSGDDIVIPAIDLGAADFAVGGWVKSTSTTYSAVISTYGGSQYYALEFNGAGAAVGVTTGRVSFVINDGSGEKVATSSAANRLNDGLWHHLAGVRNSRQIHIYVDGVLASSADIGAAYGSVGQVQAYIARYGTQSRYYQGILDEVFVAKRALTSAEIGGIAGAGVDTLNAGQYTSSVFDGEQISIWESLRWGADAPYSKPQVAGDPQLSGLWHLDALTNGNEFADSSGKGNRATLMGGSISSTGRFSGCLVLAENLDQHAEVADDGSLESAQFTIEAWINPESVGNVTVIDKRDPLAPGIGYVLALDASGRPYFWVNGMGCTNSQALRSRQWWHLAGTYDGADLRLYVNGALVGRTPFYAADVNSAGSLRIGLACDNTGDFFGKIDEVAVRIRVVSGEEIQDHYRAGAGTLRLQGRSWTSGQPGPFVGPDGTSASYFTVASLSDLMAMIPLNQYFQYQACLATEDFAVSPRFQGARVDISAYPQDNPWVAPADSSSQLFYGNLLGFSHVMASNLDTAVRYQVSGNMGTNWYYWNGGTWEDVTTFGWDVANTYGTINANIASLFTQLYPTNGGFFKFKAFLHSGGSDQVAVDSVSLGYSLGRLLVMVPNGDEVGDRAWVVGTTNIIRWTSAGTVSGTVILDYSDTSGTSWINITSNAPNNGSYAWLVPGVNQSAERSTCRIRVRDPNDTTIRDISDSDFAIVYRYRIIVPNGGEKWYIGQTNRIIWQSPPSLAGASLYYNLGGSTNDWVPFTGGVAVPTPNGTNNFYLWNTPTTNNDIISEHARIRITLFGAPVYGDWSDADYTMAGFGFLAPVQGTAWKRGNTYAIRWISAGAGTNGVSIDFASDGVTWVNIATGVTNVTGTNSYNWTVAAANPTPLARLRITSLADPNVRNTTLPFTVADIDIKSPLLGDVWPQNTTNQIQWTAGGAGNSVNIYYSTNDGVSWTVAQAAYTNVDYPATNTYRWLVPPYPGPARVKVESTLGGGDLFSISAVFNIGGVRIVSPNGDEIWRLGTVNAIQWVEASAGGGALLEFSYDNGITYTNVAGPGYPMVAHTADYTPTFPSAQCRARIQASDPGLTNIVDVSDKYFTVAGVKVVKPGLSQTNTMGVLAGNGLLWYSAGTKDDNVDVSYAPEDGREVLIMSTPNAEASATYSGANTRDWTPLLSLDPSDVAHVKVVASGSGVYTGLSERFTLRGVRLTQPGTGTIFRVGNQETIQWLSAGFDAGASAYFYVSTDGGATFGTTPLVAWATLLDIKQSYWQVDAGIDPTTNAVVKLSVTNGGTFFDAFSPRFTLRGIKILNPAATNNWAIGSTNAIRFLTAAAGNLVNIYYAQDGVNFDTANPVGLNVAVVDGVNTFNWTVESFREPTTTARIKIQSATQSDSALSEAFTIGGIKVLSPTSIDIWSINETNRIQWLSIGTSGTNTIELIQPGNIIIPIASGVTGAHFDWLVPPSAVGSNLQIRVTDAGGFTGVSQPFRIVTLPTVQIIAPQAGDFWKLTEAHTIKWNKAGNMGPSFTVEYSLNDFVSSVQILGTPVFTGGVFELTWTPDDPARLGPAKLRVTNAGNTNIVDTTETFYLVPKIEIKSPNGGETFFALKPTVVEWLTQGNTTAFDLYYSTDLTRRPERWVSVNGTNGPVVGKGHNELSQFLWTVSDVKSDIVWIRLQDANYKTMYPATQSGPYDDCDATFAIKYYTINWHVYNAANSNAALDKLSVSDSSGWSSNGLTADPYVVHEYPYGVFDTVWSREYFYDKVIFNWIPEPSRTIEVPMNQSEVSPDYRVMANFVFDTSLKAFRANVWLERAGRILASATKSVITVYNAAGTQVTQIESTSPDSGGVFWQVLSGSLDAGQSYFAKAEVQFSGVMYSSGITFNLRVPSTDEQAEAILALLNTVNTNVNDLASAQAVFRSGAMAKLDRLTNVIEQLKGLTNLQSQVEAFSNQALTRLDLLTNTIGVIGPNETNLIDTVRAFREETAQRTARILTRPTTVKLGTGVNVLFRTRPGTSVTIVVSNLTAGAWRYTGAMSEMAGGVYEKYMTATWGTGDCLVACSDGLGGVDSMILKVTMADLDDLAMSLSGVSNELHSVEMAMTGLVSSVSYISNSVSGLTTNLAGLITDVADVYAIVSNLQSTINWTNVTDLLGLVRGMSNEVALLTNLPSQMVYVTNRLGTISTLTNLVPLIALTNLTALTNMGPQLSYLTNSVAQLTNLPSQMEYVTNKLGTISTLTNLVPLISLTNLTALTNMGPQLSYLTNTVAQLTNLPSQMTYVTNIIGSLTTLTNLTSLSGLTNLLVLTNMGDRLDSIALAVTQLTNLPSQMGYVTNVIDSLHTLTNLTTLSALTNMGPQLDYVTNAVAQLGYLTNVPADVAYLTNVIRGLNALTNLTTLNGLTNMGPQLDYVTNVVAQLGYLTNVPADVAYLTNVIGGLNVLTNLATLNVLTNMGPQLDYVTNVVGQLGYLTNVPTDVAYLTNVIGGLDVLTNLMTLNGLTNMGPQLEFVTNVVGQLGYLTNVPTDVAYLTNVIGGLDVLTNLTTLNGLTNMGVQLDYLTNAVAQLGTLTNMSGDTAYLTNAIAQLGPLTNMSGGVAYLTNVIGTLNGLTNLTTLSALTNMGPQLDYLTNTIHTLDSLTNLMTLNGLTNMGARLDYLTNTIHTLDSLTNLMTLNGLTNMGSQLDYLTNTIHTLDSLTNLMILSGLTNMGSQLDYLTNTIHSLDSLTNLMVLSGLTNMGDRLDYVTNAIAQLRALTNMPVQLATLTNLPAQMNTLTNIPRQLTTLTNLQAQMNMLTNMPRQLATLTNMPTQLAALTNLSTQMNTLTNLSTQMSTLTNLPTQVSALTNMPRQLTALTNLPAQMEYVTNRLGPISGLTNLVALNGLTNMPAQLALLTNLPAQVSTLTNMPRQLATLTNLPGQVATLTNLPAQIEYATNRLGGISGLTNLVALSGLTNMPAQLAVLTNQVATLTNMPGQLTTLTNMPSQMVMLTNAVTLIQERIGTNMTLSSTKLNLVYTNTLFGRLAMLEQQLGGVGGAAQNAATMARSAKTQAAAAAGAASAVKTQLEQAQFGRMLSTIDQMHTALNATLEQVKGIPDAMSTDNLVKSLRDTMGKIDDMAKQRGVKLGQPENVAVGSLNDPQSVAKLLNTISETKAMMEAMRLLMDEAVNKPVVVNWMEGAQ